MCGTCKSIRQITNGSQILDKILMGNDDLGNVVIAGMLILKLNIKKNKLWCGLDVAGSEQCSAAVFREYNDKLIVSIQCREFLN